MAEVDRRQFLEALVALPMATDWRGHSFINASFKSYWASRRGEMISRMELVMGPYPKAKRKPPLSVRTLESFDLPTITRTKISYLSEGEDQVPAYLLIPKNLKRRVPGIICPHPTTVLGGREPAGLGGDPTKWYALELAERGYVTLAPDYPNPLSTQEFDGYRSDAYRHGYLSGTMKGIWNHMRGVDLLQSLPEVDPERIACIGHSLGGHNSLFLADFDSRIRVVVSSCGFTSFAKYRGGDLSGWAQQLYMPLIAVKYHNDPAEMPFGFSDVLAAIAPRPIFINAPIHDRNFDVSGVRDVMKLVRPIYERHFSAGNRLIVEYPDAPHSFPDNVRHKAYEFIDKWLNA